MIIMNFEDRDGHDECFVDLCNFYHLIIVKALFKDSTCQKVG